MFGLNKKNSGGSLAIKEVPGAAATYKVGETVAVDANGNYAHVAGTAKPEAICVCSNTITSGKPMYVMPIYEDCEYKTVFSADASALKAGAKVTISTTFDSVTATTTNGVATIVEKLGTGASGTEVIVKF